MPANVAVPSPLLVRVTPEGSVPVTDTVERGEPKVDTVNDPAAPTLKVVVGALLIAGAFEGP